MKIIDVQHLDVQLFVQTSLKFFSTYGTRGLLGEQFFLDMELKKDQCQFETFIEKCGYKEDSVGFFNAFFSKINAGENNAMTIHGINIPVMYAYHLLETVLGGNQLYAVKTIEQLEKIAFVIPKETSKVQEVMDQFPVRLSDHIIRQSLVSKSVAKQYLPFAQELDDTGHTLTFDGHFKNGVLEQMYQNRVIFLLDKHCPVYCRFCFRKHKSTRKEKNPLPDDVKAAVAHVQSHPLIHEILITGGEPLLNRPNMDTALNGLMHIDHVNTIRIATRSIAYYPDLFLKNDKAYIHYLIEKNLQCQKHGKRIEIGIHFVHPDEVSIQSLDIISQFVKNGIQVYVQTPFLKDLNTSGKTLARLFLLLRQVGAQIYYIFTPCHTIHGTKEYWTPIDLSFQAQRYLRQNVSDRCIPKLCTATALGKIEWNTSGWAVEQDLKDPDYTWIRTPYTLQYFEQFINHPDQMPDFRINKEGTLDARFCLDMGSKSLIAGNRSWKRESDKPISPKISVADIDVLYSHLYNNPVLSSSISHVPLTLISRVHKTRIEMKTGANDVCFDYIRENLDITDVVIFWDDALETSLNRISQMVELLKTIPHVVCVRIRSSAFSCSPQRISQKMIEKISQWSSFSIGKSLRIEIEAWFLLPEQITDSHLKVAKKLINKGVNIYVNVPLIAGINDQPDMIVRLAHVLRKVKIEFHHLYVGGLDIQRKYGLKLDHQKVIDIASLVRTQCSGRQIPLYIIQTPKGETDFGMDPDLNPFSP